MGIANLVEGDLEASVRAYDRAEGLWRESGDRRGLASSLIPYTVLGPSAHSDTLFPPLTVADAVGAGEEGLAAARAIGWRAGEAWALWALGGMALAGGGKYDRALPMTRAALALAEEIEHRQWLTAAGCMVGKLLADLYSWEEARASLTTALALARETGSIYWIRSAAGFLTAAAVLNGELALARSVVGEHLTETTPRESLDGRTLWCAAAELALAEGDAEGAMDVADRLVAAARGGRREVAPRLNRLRGEALRALGRLDGGEDALRAAATAAESIGALPLEWRARSSLVHLLLAYGRTDEADAERAAGTDLVSTLASRVPENRLRDGFLAAALATFPGTPARQATSRQRARNEAAGLTERERAVVALLTQGRTNREIGEALFVTEWTAATHVRNILAKLGLRSRAEVAAWGVKHGIPPAQD